MSVSEISTLGIPKQLLDRGTTSAEANVVLDAGSSLQTGEGDVVTLNLANKTSLSNSHSGIELEDSEMVQEISSVAQAASTFSEVVEGGLNKDELTAIQKLAARIEPIAKDFLSSDLEELSIDKAISVLTGSLSAVEEVELELERTVAQTFAPESLSQVNLDDVVSPDTASVETEVPAFNIENIRQLPTLVSATVDAGFEKQFQALNETSRELIVNSLTELMQFFRQKVVQVLEPLRHPNSLAGGESQVPVEVDLTAQPQA